jgi:hypothetical protein
VVLGIAAAACLAAATAVATIVTHSLPVARSVFGFVERLLYLTSIAWLLLASIDLAANA